MTYGKFGKFVGSLLKEHPKLWVNPMSVHSIFRALTGSLRVLPNFIIIGAAKCGTTSLFNYMTQHPNIYPALWKEIYFFDRYFTRESQWYRANFPTKFYKSLINFKNKKFITGEATPTYIHHPLVPQRIFETIPDVKLIVLLRNPIDRAYSHHQMEVSLGFEDLPFEEAINREPERLEGEKEKMLEDHNYFSYKRQMYSYLSSGIYVEQLRLWMKIFSKDKFLIIKTEDFSEKPKEILKQVFTFLDIQQYELPTYEKFNLGKYSGMTEQIKKRLINYYKPHNAELYKFLGRNFNWDC
jgi:hypothetical protein